MNADRASDPREHQSSRICKMLDLLGLDLADVAIANELMAQATLRACMYCRAADECGAWQSRQAGAVKEAPAFCPNRARLAGMKNLRAS